MVLCLTEGVKKMYSQTNQLWKGQGGYLGMGVGNPAFFQCQLVEAFIKFTNIDPSSLEGKSLLRQHFINQPAPDIRRKLQQLHYGPQTLVAQLLDMNFGVFNNQDQAEENKRTQRETRQDRWQAQMLAVTISKALQPQDHPTETKGHPLQP